MYIFVQVLKYSESLKQKYCKKHGSNNLYHTDIDIFSAEFFSVFRNFVDNSLWLCNPADKNTGENCNDRHKNVVTEIVEYVKNLTDRAGRKFKLKVKYVVAEANDYAENNSVCSNNNSTLFSA